MTFTSLLSSLCFVTILVSDLNSRLTSINLQTNHIFTSSFIEKLQFKHDSSPKIKHFIIVLLNVVFN